MWNVATYQIKGIKSQISQHNLKTKLCESGEKGLLYKTGGESL